MVKSYPSIGSINCATMRPEDLIPAFMSALEDIRESISLPGPTTESAESVQERKETVARLDTLLREIEERMGDEEQENSYAQSDYFVSEEAMWDLEALEQELNNHAPPYCYFGANEGDGADYGFWFCGFESIEEDIDAGEVIRVEAGAEWPEDEIRERVEVGCLSYIVEVNDHGNITLFTPDHTEIWSLV